MSEAARIDLVDRAPLTEKQQNVYESIMQYQRVNGYVPTLREICKMVGVASTSSVYAHLKIVGFRSAKTGNVQTFIGTPGKRLARDFVSRDLEKKKNSLQNKRHSVTITTEKTSWR